MYILSYKRFIHESSRGKKKRKKKGKGKERKKERKKGSPRSRGGEEKRLSVKSLPLFSSSLPRTRLTDPRLSFSTRANLIQNKTTSLRSSIARRKKRGRGGRTNLYRNIGQNVRRSIGAHLAPVPLAHSAIRALNFSFPPPPPSLCEASAWMKTASKTSKPIVPRDCNISSRCKCYEGRLTPTLDSLDVCTHIYTYVSTLFTREIIVINLIRFLLVFLASFISFEVSIELYCISFRCWKMDRRKILLRILL